MLAKEERPPILVLRSRLVFPLALRSRLRPHFYDFAVCETYLACGIGLHFPVLPRNDASPDRRRECPFCPASSRPVSGTISRHDVNGKLRGGGPLVDVRADSGHIEIR
jgi:hypothetical protein